MTVSACLIANKCGVSASRKSADEADDNVNWIPEDTLAQVVYINGVPVYNYHKAYHAVSGAPLSTSTRAKRREEQVDWILVFPEGDSDLHVGDMCDGLENSAACLWRGNPGKGGVPASVVRCTESELERILYKYPNMKFVEPDQPLSVPPDESGVEDEPYADSIPWGLDRINARKGLDGYYGVVGGAGVHVYVVDTGIRATHEDFGGRVIPTLDVVDNSIAECSRNETWCANDWHGHGTHCAGTVGGTSSGVAPLSTLHAVKVFLNNGTGRWAWYLQALDYVAAKGERPAVVSASLGGQSRGHVVAVKTFIDKVVNAGVPVVVAAGNQNDDACKYTPGFVGSAIAVASTTRSDRRSSFSNQGPCVDIFAPGSLIRSASNKGDAEFRFSSGTSMACPHVAGAAALLMAQNTSLTPADVVTAVQRIATRGVVSDVELGSPNMLLYVRSVYLGRIHWATRPDKCMDVLGGNPSNGNNIALWDCIDGSWNQRFLVPGRQGVGQIQWGYRFRHCVDVLGGNPMNGNNIALWECINDNPNQEFFGPPVEQTGRIYWNANRGKCLDVLGGNPRNGNNIGLWDCQEGNPNQMFIFKYHDY